MRLGLLFKLIHKTSDEMTSKNRVSASEDINGAKWDRCLTDSIVKTGLNLLIFNPYR